MRQVTRQRTWGSSESGNNTKSQRQEQVWQGERQRVLCGDKKGGERRGGGRESVLNLNEE